MGRHAEGWKLEWRHGIGYVRFTHAKRQYLISTGKRDIGAAGEEAARLYSRVISGGVARPSATRSLSAAPLTTLWAEWLASLVGTLDVETLKTYETIYVGKHWPDHYDKLSDMCSEAARERYRSARLKKATASTVKKETWTQDKFLRWCKKNKAIGETPARLEWDKRTLGTRTGKQRVKVRRLTKAQVAAFLAALPEWRETGRRATKNKPYAIRGRFVFMYETSLRPATLNELRWSDWTGQTLIIRDESDKVRFGREVPLTAVATRVLEMVREEAAARGVRTAEADLIFGKHLYRKTIARAAKKAGVDGVAPYDLRHARATHLADDGASLTGIGHILGHKQATTTSRYLHGSMRAAEEALSRSPTQPTQNDASKPGWPTGLEPATTGATRHRSDNSINDIGPSGADRDRREPPESTKILGGPPRIADGVDGFDFGTQSGLWSPLAGPYVDGLLSARGVAS